MKLNEIPVSPQLNQTVQATLYQIKLKQRRKKQFHICLLYTVILYLCILIKIKQQRSK